MENSITDPSSSVSLKDDIRMIRDWLEKQIHLPKEFDDELLSLFIKGCKSLEQAKKKLDQFCTTNSKYPDKLLMPNIDAEFRESLEFSKVFFLPDPLPDGTRVMMMVRKNPEKFNHQLHNKRLWSMIFSLKRLHPDLPGLACLVDSSNCDMAFIRKVSFTEFVICLNILQNYFPMRLKLYLLYNSDPKSEVIANNVMSFVPKKMQGRIFITSEGVSILKNYVPPEILPCDYPGGKAPSSDQLNEDGIKLLESQMDWLNQIAQLRADEEKRPPDVESAFGVEGTFRKLNVD